MRIIGIDPGSVICGYGVIEKQQQNFVLIECGSIKVKKLTNSMPERLKEIFLTIGKIVERTNPDASVFESVFFSKNVQSTVKLSQARAAAILAIVMQNIPVFEYSPREIKKSVTGKGSAGKEQVLFMVNNLLKISLPKENLDTSDALAVALCHFLKNPISSKSNKSWADFIKKNPDRIVR
ncbi:MAG: crossover junction endodeoxyribonuclease RuvC [Ignavibacteria bacterium]|nr:crossover junction endodeoxyribonuclease RuvC [Ignavibacteria bacterium]